MMVLVQLAILRPSSPSRKFFKTFLSNLLSKYVRQGWRYPHAMALRRTYLEGSCSKPRNHVAAGLCNKHVQAQQLIDVAYPCPHGTWLFDGRSR